MDRLAQAVRDRLPAQHARTPASSRPTSTAPSGTTWASARCPRRRTSITATTDAAAWVSADGFVWEQNGSNWVSPGSSRDGQTPGTSRSTSASTLRRPRTGVVHRRAARTRGRPQPGGGAARDASGRGQGVRHVLARATRRPRAAPALRRVRRAGRGAGLCPRACRPAPLVRPRSAGLTPSPPPATRARCARRCCTTRSAGGAISPACSAGSWRGRCSACWPSAAPPGRAVRARAGAVAPRGRAARGGDHVLRLARRAGRPAGLPVATPLRLTRVGARLGRPRLGRARPATWPRDGGAGAAPGPAPRSSSTTSSPPARRCARPARALRGRGLAGAGRGDRGRDTPPPPGWRRRSGCGVSTHWRA